MMNSFSRCKKAATLRTPRSQLITTLKTKTCNFLSWRLLLDRSVRPPAHSKTSFMYHFIPLSIRLSRKRNPSVSEIGKSSNSENADGDGGPPFICEICVEQRTAKESFNIKGCSHSYCKNCMAKYVASKLEENLTSIPCPASNCGGLLEPDHCRNILPENIFDRWGNALCEGVILESQKFYCPYKDCSALLIDDGREVIRKSECPNCRRMFCAQCKVPWHAGVGCRELERSSEDIMLMRLAKEKKWQRCPHCNYYVEKKSGCKYMKCRCGYAFCYICGVLLNPCSHTRHKCDQ